MVFFFFFVRLIGILKSQASYLVATNDLFLVSCLVSNSSCEALSPNCQLPVPFSSRAYIISICPSVSAAALCYQLLGELEMPMV
jgi:hypothetical protein